MRKLLRMASYTVLPLAALMMFSSYSGSSNDNPCPPSDYLGPDVMFSNPADCNSYYQCSNGVAVLMRCPDGLHFNPELRTCDVPEDAGFDDGFGGGMVVKKCYTIFSNNKAGYDYYASCSGNQNGDIMYQCAAISMFQPAWGVTLEFDCYQPVY